MVNKIYGLLEICSKAGKITAGTEAVIEGVLKNQIELVIIAEDTSQKTKQKIEKICAEKKVMVKVNCNEQSLNGKKRTDPKLPWGKKRTDPFLPKIIFKNLFLFSTFCDKMQSNC